MITPIINQRRFRPWGRATAMILEVSIAPAIGARAACVSNDISVVFPSTGLFAPSVAGACDDREARAVGSLLETKPRVKPHSGHPSRMTGR